MSDKSLMRYEDLISVVVYSFGTMTDRYCPDIAFASNQNSCHLFAVNGSEDALALRRPVASACDNSDSSIWLASEARELMLQ